MGSARTGKTSLIGQFLYNSYSPRYRPTVEDMHTVELDCQGKSNLLSHRPQLNFIDPNMMETYIRKCRQFGEYNEKPKTFFFVVNTPAESLWRTRRMNKILMLYVVYVTTSFLLLFVQGWTCAWISLTPEAATFSPP